MIQAGSFAVVVINGVTAVVVVVFVVVVDGVVGLLLAVVCSLVCPPILFLVFLPERV